MASNWATFGWPAVSLHGGEIDLLFLGLLATSALATALLAFLLISFAVRYRAGNDVDRGHRITKSWHWEVGWTTATLVAFLVLFAWGAALYLRLYDVSGAGLAIHVVAKQWMWKVQHPGGQAEINELHMPVHRPIMLVMASQDVIHSFFIPALRVKRDVVPGRYQRLRIEAEKPGVYHLFCAEFCGTDHPGMTGRIVVLKDRDFATWLARQGAGDSLAHEGAALFRQLGCSGCHAAASRVRAPLLDGLYGGPVPLADGTVTVADERYVRDSILQPNREVVAGYEPVMPSFAGKVSEEDLIRLIAYIKSLAQPDTPEGAAR